MQEDRKRAHNQVRALGENIEPHSVILWLAQNSQTLENNIKGALEVYAKSQAIGQWSLSIVGIGPIISAGLMANVPIEDTPGVSNLWSYAGQSPESKWEKGTKRPWNASLKVLCWKIGESFVKFQNHPEDFYGAYYVERKEQEVAANDRGDFVDQAAKALQEKSFRKDTKAKESYENGQLPPAHIHARAKRWVVKLFLSHWWTVAYTLHYGKGPETMPYVFNRLGHKHFISPPNFP
jgi:hypothetical protein